MTFAFAYHPVAPESVRVESVYVGKDSHTEVTFVGAIVALGERVQARVDRLQDRTSVDGWDHQNGRAIAASVWTRTRNICNRVGSLIPGLAYPFPSPCGDGTVHVRWNVPDGREAILEIGSSDDIAFTLVSNALDGSPIVEAGKIDSDSAAVTLVIRKLG